MVVYVAGKYEEKERVQEVMEQLLKAGHEIAFDWTRNDEGFTPRQALRDFSGVCTADAFVFVAEKDLAYKGAHCEFGMALARGLPCYILGSYADGNVFTLLPGVHRGLEGLLGR